MAGLQVRGQWDKVSTESEGNGMSSAEGIVMVTEGKVMKEIGRMGPKGEVWMEVEGIGAWSNIGWDGGG